MSLITLLHIYYRVPIISWNVLIPKTANTSHSHQQPSISIHSKAPSSSICHYFSICILRSGYLCSLVGQVLRAVFNYSFRHYYCRKTRRGVLSRTAFRGEGTSTDPIRLHTEGVPSRSRNERNVFQFLVWEKKNKEQGKPHIRARLAVWMGKTNFHSGTRFGTGSWSQWFLSRSLGFPESDGEWVPVGVIVSQWWKLLYFQNLRFQVLNDLQ